MRPLHWISIGIVTLIFVAATRHVFGQWQYSQGARAGFLIIAGVGCVAWGLIGVVRNAMTGPSVPREDDRREPENDLAFPSLGRRLNAETCFRPAATCVAELESKLLLSLDHGRIGDGDACYIKIGHDPDLDGENLIKPIPHELERIYAGPGPHVSPRRSKRFRPVASIKGEVSRDEKAVIFTVNTNVDAVIACLEERIPAVKPGTGPLWLSDLLRGAIELPWETFARERIFDPRGQLEWSRSAQVARIMFDGKKIAERRLISPA